MLYGRCMGHLQVLSAALLPLQALLSGSLIPVHPLHWRQPLVSEAWRPIGGHGDLWGTALVG
jgi:hypothetical protein